MLMVCDYSVVNQLALTCEVFTRANVSEYILEAFYLCSGQLFCSVTMAGDF